MTELRGLGAIHAQVRQAGGQLLLVSRDAATDSQRVVKNLALPFEILVDADMSTIRAYGVLHAKGGPDGGDVALPSHFIISRDGRVRWRFIATRVQDRPDLAHALAALRGL